MIRPTPAARASDTDNKDRLCCVNFLSQFRRSSLEVVSYMPQNSLLIRPLL
jgi:hypothetical protein